MSSFDRREAAAAHIRAAIASLDVAKDIANTDNPDMAKEYRLWIQAARDACCTVITQMQVVSLEAERRQTGGGQVKPKNSLETQKCEVCGREFRASAKRRNCYRGCKLSDLD